MKYKICAVCKQPSGKHRVCQSCKRKYPTKISPEHYQPFNRKEYFERDHQ